MTPQLLALLAYAALLVAAGLWIGRRVADAAGFFVAGRRLGPGLVGATVLAANIGAGSTVGAASLGWRDGLAAWWWVGSAGIGTLLLAFWLGPRLWYVARDHDLRTVGDYLEHRFGAATRGVVAALLWLGTLAILAGQLIAMAWVLNAVAGTSKVVGCLLGGLVLVLYFAGGGLGSAVWVNFLQLVVLMSGFLLALPLALDAAGGWPGVRAAAPREDWLGFFAGGGSGLVFVPLLVPAFLVSPGLIQKAWGAKSARAVRLGLGWSGAALLLFAALPPLLGMAARARHPALDSIDLALPTLLVSDLPPVLGLLGLAAVLSAEISSADALLFMLATSLSQDLWGRFVEPGASEAKRLKVARLAAVAGGGAGIVLAIFLPTVVGALSIFYSLLSVSLFVPLVAGVHGRRAGEPAALAAIGTGVATLVAVELLTGGTGVGPLPPTLLGIAASAVAYGVVGRTAPAPCAGSPPRRPMR